MGHKILGITAAIAMLATAADAEAGEIAISCEGEALDIVATKGTLPKVDHKTLPNRVYIIDFENKKVWAWLDPKNERDLLCDTQNCFSTFNDKSIDLYWDYDTGGRWHFRTDRVTGHTIHRHEIRSDLTLVYGRWDMMCAQSQVPSPSLKRRY